MPTYQYKARDKYGRAIRGVIEDENREGAARRLETMGYTPVAIVEKSGETGAGVFSFFPRISTEELNFFTRQLMTMLDAGLPMVTSLYALKEQTRNRYFAGVIAALIRDLEAGSSFSEALSRHPRVFNELYVAMARSGEAAGILGEVLGRLADLGEYEANVRSQINSATRYPLITFTALCLAAVVMLTFVIPQFASLFRQFNTALPLPTRILIATDFVFRRWWALFLGAAVLAAVGFWKTVRTKAGKTLWDALQLKIPVFGPLIFKITMARFSRITAMLIKSGLPILQILEMVARTTGNVIVARAIDEIRVSVNEGQGMAKPMRASRMFSPVVIQMVAVGEETGKMDDLLFRVAEHYEQQVNYTIRNLTALIEPFFIVILAGGVLLMALAVMLPMWNLIALLKK